MDPFDDDNGISGVGLLYGSLIVIGVACIILGCGALSIHWLQKLFLPLMILGLISPLAASVAAIFLFVRHRDRVEPERRVPTIGYILAIVICAAVGGCFGLVIGLHQACPQMGNLCFLWAVFVTGPIFLSLGILLVGVVVFLIRPAPGPD